MIGARCKIQSHTLRLRRASRIDDEVFVGHGVMFINDKRPRATTRRTASSRPTDDWELLPTTSVERGATHRLRRRHPRRRARSATGALVGAGAVVTRDVPAARDGGGRAGAGAGLSYGDRNRPPTLGRSPERPRYRPPEWTLTPTARRPSQIPGRPRSTGSMSSRRRLEAVAAPEHDDVARRLMREVELDPHDRLSSSCSTARAPCSTSIPEH